MPGATTANKLNVTYYRLTTLAVLPVLSEVRTDEAYPVGASLSFDNLVGRDAPAWSGGTSKREAP